MGIVSIVLAVFFCLMLLVVIMINNSLVRRKNKVDEAFGSIDVYFEKRSDLIPNLVTIVKEQANYESSTLEKITALRSQMTDSSNKGNVDEQVNLQKQMTNLLADVKLTAEAYPQLCANRAYMNLQYEFSAIESDMAAARRFYNASVNAYNNKIEEFPSNVIAGFKNYKTKPFFETTAEKRKDIDAKSLFND